MSLKAAIEQLEAEVADYRQGTTQQPKDGSVDWFVLRAKSIGLNSLKRAAQLKLENPIAAERFFRASGRILRHDTEVGSEPR